VTVCDETAAPGRHARCSQTQVSVKQKRHGEHDSVTVTIAEGFRSASYDPSLFIRSDVRHSRRVARNTWPPPPVCDLECLAEPAMNIVMDVRARFARWSSILGPGPGKRQLSECFREDRRNCGTEVRSNGGTSDPKRCNEWH
jgi:hypothetical protein